MLYTVRVYLYGKYFRGKHNTERYQKLLSFLYKLFELSGLTPIHVDYAYLFAVSKADLWSQREVVETRVVPLQLNDRLRLLNTIPCDLAFEHSYMHINVFSRAWSHFVIIRCSDRLRRVLGDIEICGMPKAKIHDKRVKKITYLDLC